MWTDTSERGLERLICTALTGSPCDARVVTDRVGKAKLPPQVGLAGSAAHPTTTTASTRSIWYSCLRSSVETQPDAFEGLRLEDDGPARRKFLARLQGEISKRGVVDVLRKGVKDGPHHVEHLLWHAVSRQPCRR